MHGIDGYSKFASSLSKFVNKKWTKVRSSRSSLKSSQDLDQLLEEEYETLLREIDYLSSEKTCYLSFKNERFSNGKSSEDLTKVLNYHSEEVLRTYIAKHDKGSQKKRFDSHEDIVNYVTKIIVSPPKCNEKLCTCRGAKSNEVGKYSSKNEKGEQTSQHSQKLTENRLSYQKPDDSEEISKKREYLLADEHSNKKTQSFLPNLVSTEVQTDNWDHDPNCTCGCCPKTGSKIKHKNVETEETKLQDPTTSNGKTTTSTEPETFSNCKGETVEAQTSTTNKLCVPENFEALLESTEANTFSICTGKQDCGCDAYDAKTAVKRGLILPSSDICIQNKTAKIKQKKIKTSVKKVQACAPSTTSDSNETTAETSSLTAKMGQLKSRNLSMMHESIPLKNTYLIAYEEKGKDKDPKKKKDKKKANMKDKNGNKKKAVVINNSSEQSGSTSSTPREKPKKQKQGTTGCFGSKKKTHGCDEYCQGVVGRQRSVQTVPIGTQDKNEYAQLDSENEKKAIQTSTKSETGIQVSARSSKQDSRNNNKQDKETSQKENKESGEGNKPSERINAKASQRERDRDKHDQENKAKSNGGVTCNKCGRQKRDCVSGCRNTIIIPYDSGSNRAIPAGEADSLRMLIKMQCKDTSRQFDNIMAQLNQQKSEIRRLNDLYQKMVENFYEQQKSHGSSRSYSKNTSDVSHGCECPSNNNNKKSDAAKTCGCTFSNECKIDSNRNSPTEKSTHISNNSYNPCSCGNHSNIGDNGGPVRRFGPPNTAVAINMCDTCTVEIAANNVRTNPSRNYECFDGDKRRKEQLNQSKKIELSNENITVHRENNNTLVGKGDTRRTDSVSTLFKNNRKKVNNKNAHLDQSEGYADLLDGITREEEGEYIEEVEEELHAQSLPKISIKFNDIDVDTDPSQIGKQSKKAHSSKMLVWLRKSWVIMKYKTEECRRKDKERREERKSKMMDHVLNFCHITAKHTGVGLWNYVKNSKMFS